VLHQVQRGNDECTVRVLVEQTARSLLYFLSDRPNGFTNILQYLVVWLEFQYFPPFPMMWMVVYLVPVVACARTCDLAAFI